MHDRAEGRAIAYYLGEYERRVKEYEVVRCRANTSENSEDPMSYYVQYSRKKVKFFHYKLGYVVDPEGVLAGLASGELEVLAIPDTGRGSPQYSIRRKMTNRPAMTRTRLLEIREAIDEGEPITYNREDYHSVEQILLEAINKNTIAGNKTKVLQLDNQLLELFVAHHGHSGGAR